eukprot:bmy_13669T0
MNLRPKVSRKGGGKSHSPSSASLSSLLQPVSTVLPILSNSSTWPKRSFLEEILGILDAVLGRRNKLASAGSPQPALMVDEKTGVPQNKELGLCNWTLLKGSSTKF